MKKSFLAIASLAFLLTACKETPPVIIFHPTAASSVDTTYVVAAIPPSDPHSVLVEEYTGASCTNCPAAHELLNELEKEHVGRINVIGLYITGPIQTRPPEGHKYDFRHTEATLIANDIYGGISLLPSAGIDRTRVSGSIKLERALWLQTIDNQLNIQDSINMRIACTYNAADGMLSIIDTTIYTKSVGFPHNLSIAVVEDSIIDVQEYPSTDPVHPGKDEEYVFTNVFRGMVTAAPVGDAMLTSLPVKEAGRVVVRNYKFKLSAEYNPAHCRVIAFISSAEAGQYRVMQSTQAKVK